MFSMYHLYHAYHLSVWIHLIGYERNGYLHMTAQSSQVWWSKQTELLTGAATVTQFLN